jgi:uncharacterized protein (TIGR02996 family)
MIDGPTLRSAVIINPDDDTPRLIYADWLDENGQPDRATFIRLQIEAARAERFGLQARSLQGQAEQLLDTHLLPWTRHLNGQIVGLPQFQRGFIHHVAIDALASESVLTTLLQAEPIQSVSIVRTAYDSDWISLLPIFELAPLRQIRQLQFVSRTGFLHDEYARLTSSPHLRGVQKLSLRNIPIHPPWLVEMMCGDAFPELSGLDLAEITNLGLSVLNAVSQATHRELRCLDISNVRFNSDQLQRVLASRCLYRIEELNLGYTGYRDDPGPLFHLDVGWVIPWELLIVLDLAGQRLGDEGVRQITAQREAGALRWLGLAKNELSSETIRLFTQSKHLDLKYLDVRANGFTASAIAALQQRFPEAVIVY